jgi:hypothetical protein
MNRARGYVSTEIFCVRHTGVFKCGAYSSMAAGPRRTNGERALQLACWIAVRVHCRILELDNILSQHRLNMCLVNEMHFSPVQAFLFANYVCHGTDRLTEGGITVMLVRCGIGHYILPALALRHLQATAIHVILASRPVKVLAMYVSPSRPQLNLTLLLAFVASFPSLAGA